MAAVYDCRRHIIVVRVIAYNRMTTGKELHQYSERCPYEARAHRVLGVFVFTELLLLLLSYLSWGSYHTGSRTIHRVAAHHLPLTRLGYRVYADGYLLHRRRETMTRLVDCDIVGGQR